MPTPTRSAYRALRGMAELADRVGENSDAARYRQRAQQIHDAYPGAFIDPAAGVVSGWRSSDGQLHNYFFPFVNGIAVRYGLVEGQQAQDAMNGILAKMENVGYRNFALGLPGNLVPIRRADYVDLDPRFGGPTKATAATDSRFMRMEAPRLASPTSPWRRSITLGIRSRATRFLCPCLTLSPSGVSQAEVRMG